MSDAPDGNPFATRWTRPGAIPFLFASSETSNDSASPPEGNEPGCLTSLVKRLAENDYRGQIVGPHGSGKSTLLAALVPAIEATGRRTMVYRLHDGQRKLPDEPAPLRTAEAETLVVVDGYEQLSRWQRGGLARICLRRRLGLLVTTHEPAGLPDLFETKSDLPLAERIVKRLLERHAANGATSLISADDIAAAVAAHPGNLREALFALYDVYEERRMRGLS